MPEDGKKVAVVLGIAALVGGAIILATKVKEVPPTPPAYTCPYCGAIFTTEDELIAHIQQEHPGERIPIHIIWQ